MPQDKEDSHTSHLLFILTNHVIFVSIQKYIQLPFHQGALINFSLRRQDFRLMGLAELHQKRVFDLRLLMMHLRRWLVVR